MRWNPVRLWRLLKSKKDRDSMTAVIWLVVFIANVGLCLEMLHGSRVMNALFGMVGITVAGRGCEAFLRDYLAWWNRLVRKVELEKKAEQ